MSTNFQKKITEQLEAIGIIVNGSKASDIQVYNPHFYSRVLSKSTLGLGEAYMDGWWDAQKLDEFFNLVLRGSLSKNMVSRIDVFDYIKAKIINLQTPKKALEVGKRHYDVGNFLYQHMLDPLMNYTCGYWKNANNLAEAQEAKLDLIAKKLYLKPGMKVLDIGCGFGGAAKFMAERYDVEVVGITISKEQLTFAQENFSNNSVELLFLDYRELIPKYTNYFERIYSTGMFEHVGYKNYFDYFKVVYDCLKDDGLFLLHTIGGNKSVISGDPWIERYIFPNGMLPSIKQISQSIENLFVMEDWHSFGPDYDKTLMAWFDNFTKNWQEISEFHPSKYNENFFRMWKYYLLISAATFRSRINQLWQIVLSKQNSQPDFYCSIR